MATTVLERPRTLTPSRPKAGALRRRRSLDGLRGLATILVVGSHTHLAAFKQGFVGVDIFFVLSGFLITGLLLARPQPYGSFLRNRVARLVPALLAALVVISLEQTLTTGFDGHCAALASTHTMDLGSLGATTCAGTWHVTWSLAFEEQFYVLWPLLLVGLVKLSRRWAAGALALLWLTNAVRLCIITTHETGNDSRYLYSPDGRALSILLGCSVAFLFADERAARWMAGRRRLAVWPSALGAVLIAIPLVPTDRGTWWSAVVADAGGAITLCSLCGLGTALLVLGLRWSGEESRWARVLAFAPLVGVGAISYSLYLLHLVPITLARSWFPGQTALAAGVGVAIALVLAIGSRHLIEKPFQRRLRGVPSPA